MKSTIITFLVTILLVSGCDSVNWQQYQVAGVIAGSPDAVRLKSVLQTFAAQAGMDDKTSRSHVTNALCYYTQQPQG
jgi:hypothetical protein